MKYIFLFTITFLLSCGGGGGGSSGSSSGYSSSSSSSSSSGSSSSSSSQQDEFKVTKTNLTLPDGSSREVLQIEGASAIQTLGGIATSEKRTIYGYDEVATTYNGTEWPIVRRETGSRATFSVESGITATFSFEANQVKVNDSYIVYQYTGDTDGSSASGDGINNVWYALNLDGTGTNTYGLGLGNIENPTHRITSPDSGSCTQVDKVFFCSLPENELGEFTFCASYCTASQFQFELEDTFSAGWTINSDGVLTLPAQDFEAMLVKFEQVDVTKISPNGNQTTYTVRFTITDVDESASGSSSSSSSNQSTSSSGNTAPNLDNLSSEINHYENILAVVNVLATDADDDALTYSLDGTDAGSFTISSEGLISFVNSPDFESIDIYQFNVKVSDGTATTAKAITINIINVNEAPTFSLSDTININEGTTAIATVSASDVDGDSLSFSVSGTDSSDFSITSGGVLSLNSAADFESKPTYDLTVSVSDGSLSYNESLKVNVANVDEPFVQIGATLSAEADGDSFGYSVDVAQSSSSVPGGTIVAVGAPRNSNDYGSARVFSFVDGSWSQLGNDIDSPNSSFSGHDVSLNSDGTILAVGGGNYGVGQGWVRVYQLSGGTSWNLLGDSIVGQANNIRSGGDVELSNDGTVLAVAATSKDGPGFADQGEVTIYNYSSGSWNAGNTYEGGGCTGTNDANHCNHTISLSGDGTVLAIFAGRGNTETYPGETKIYNVGGAQKGSTITGSAFGDNIGANLALSENGNIVALRGYEKVKVYEYSNSSNDWVQLGSDITALSSTTSPSSISLSADGLTLAYGDPSSDTNATNTGTVRIFKFVSGTWTQVGSDIVGESEGVHLGTALKLNSSGDILVVGQSIDAAGEDIGGTVKVYQDQ